MQPDLDHGPSRRAACTIIARNYLAQARVLAESYLRYEPDGHFFILVVDHLPEGVELAPRITPLGPEDLHIPEFLELAFKYDVTELSTAVKPWLMSAIMDDYGAQQVVYFDPDIQIFRPLDEMWQLLDQSNILLIPHLLDPIPLDGKRPSEQDILISGAYNLGFIGLKKSDEAMRMLDWWRERLRDLCSVDVAHGLFVDQKWIDLVPSLFSGTQILRDPGYDVAYWNLHSRPLQRTPDGWLVSGRPLGFFHFSGFDPANPRSLSKHQNRISIDNGTPLAELLDGYGAALDRFGFPLTRTWSYGYGHFDNGLGVSTVHRHLFGKLPLDQRRAFLDPFRTAEPQSFFKWSGRPEPEGLSPFLEQVLVESTDARIAFPEARGRQRSDFLKWAATWGAEGFGYDPRLADPDAWDKLVATSVTPLSGARPVVEGINVIGYLTSETGLGAAARGYIRAFKSMGVPVALRDLAELTPNRSQDTSLGIIDGDTPYRINLFVVNADQHFVVKSHLGDAFFHDHYNIGSWAWELPSFPPEWLDRFPEYDEIWTLSSFIANTLAPLSPIPVIRMPTVLTLPEGGSRDDGRRRLGVDDNTFVYLFIFDFASYFERKNPLASIQAFTQAFASDDDVRLVIKCVNEHLDPDAFTTMSDMAAGHPVAILNGYWSTEEMRDLMLACDAYVSLHRSEGLGHTIADAMYAEKPVIATGWSGNMDFMSVGNSFPVAFELIQVTEDVGPYKAGSLWAEPSVEDAARLMRLVRDDQGLARQRAQTARREIASYFSEASRGQAMQQRLAQASAALRRKHGSSVPASNGRPRKLVAPTVEPMDLGDSSHGRFGVLAKRGVDSLLRYHNHYQGEINLGFARFMRDLLADHEEQASLLAVARQHISGLDAKLAGLSKDVERVDGYFAARPYMARDAYGSEGDLRKPMGYSSDTGEAPGFEDLFRGAEEFIIDRQRVYLRFFKGATNVVDLGCGRGEFLKLLCEVGINAVGVELDPALVDMCRSQELRAEHADAYEYLESVPEDSLDVIFSAQFIEHVHSDRLGELLQLARTRLRKNGLFIAETVNPESYLAQKTFYVDLTHQRPIFPQVLLYLCQSGGYSSARIFYPTAGGFTQTAYRDAGEYAVIAVK